MKCSLFYLSRYGNPFFTISHAKISRDHSYIYLKKIMILGVIQSYNLLPALCEKDNRDWTLFQSLSVAKVLDFRHMTSCVRLLLRRECTWVLSFREPRLFIRIWCPYILFSSRFCITSAFRQQFSPPTLIISYASQRAKRREEINFVYGEVTEAAAWISIIIIIIAEPILL